MKRPLRGILFPLVLVLFVCLRGINLATILAPFEGCDEYNYIAVAAQYDATGILPNPAEPIPPDEKLLAFYRAHPHPEASAIHLAGVGVLNYRGEVWQAGEWITPPDTLPPKSYPSGMPAMFQAQQGAFYYILLVGLKRVFGITSLGVWADAARLFNIAMLALTVLLWWWLFRQVWTGDTATAFASCAAVLVATNSLMMNAAAGVNNNILPMFLGSIALTLFIILKKSAAGQLYRRILLTLGAGFFCGLAVLGRITALPLAPVLLLAFGGLTWEERREHLRGGILLTGCFLLSFLFLTGGEFAAAMRETGSVSRNVTSVKLKQEGKGLRAIARALAYGEISGDNIAKKRWDDIRHYLFYNYNHQGSWSFRDAPPDTRRIFRYLLRASMLCFLLAMIVPKARQRFFSWLKTSREIWGLYALTTLALLYIAGVTLVAYGQVAGNTRYGLLAWPAFAMLLLGGAFCLSRRLGGMLAAGYIGLSGYVYYWVAAYDMPRYMTGFSDNSGGEFSLNTALASLAGHHELLDIVPVFSLLWIEGGLFCVLLALALVPVFKTAQPALNSTS